MKNKITQEDIFKILTGKKTVKLNAINEDRFGIDRRKPNYGSADVGGHGGGEKKTGDDKERRDGKDKIDQKRRPKKTKKVPKPAPKQDRELSGQKGWKESDIRIESFSWDSNEKKWESTNKERKTVVKWEGVDPKDWFKKETEKMHKYKIFVTENGKILKETEREVSLTGAELADAGPRGNVTQLGLVMGKAFGKPPEQVATMAPNPDTGGE